MPASPTTNGSRSLKDDVATEHAVVTQRFLDAGLVIFGKTNTPEFGAKGITEDSLLGTARNPWNLNHTPGGSSGGSGAAVAAGIVPAAGANDGGGSVRIPAACNGLVGLKLSRGLTPYGPQTSESMFGMTTQGVVSRTVRDSAALLDAVAGAPDRYAAYVAGRPEPYLENLAQRPAEAADRLLALLRDQRRPRPGSDRRCRERRRPADRARPRGRGGEAAPTTTPPWPATS